MGFFSSFKKKSNFECARQTTDVFKIKRRPRCYSIFEVSLCYCTKIGGLVRSTVGLEFLLHYFFLLLFVSPLMLQAMIPTTKCTVLCRSSFGICIPRRMAAIGISRFGPIRCTISTFNRKNGFCPLLYFKLIRYNNV